MAVVVPSEACTRHCDIVLWLTRCCVQPAPDYASGWQQQVNGAPPGGPPPNNNNSGGGNDGWPKKAVIAGAFALGLGAGVWFSEDLNFYPSNVASTELVDRRTPNSEVCISNGYSAMVFDQRLFVSFNPCVPLILALPPQAWMPGLACCMCCVFQSNQSAR